MNLAPCRDCHRHVIVGAPCPFCGAPSPKARPVFRPRAAGRFALLFASTMGLSGCAEEASAPPELPVTPAPLAPVPEPLQPMEEIAQPEPTRPEPLPELEPVAPDEVTPEEPVVRARPVRPAPDQTAVPAYGGPATRPDPGMIAAYGSPSFDEDL